MAGPANNQKIAGLILLVFILVGLYAHAMYTDMIRAREHKLLCATESMMNPKHSEIEESIHVYKYKKALAEQKTAKMSAAMLLGIMRGAIIGIVLGGEAGVIDGMVSFASLNGILYWLGENLTV